MWVTVKIVQFQFKSRWTLSNILRFWGVGSLKCQLCQMQRYDPALLLTFLNGPSLPSDRCISLRGVCVCICVCVFLMSGLFRSPKFIGDFWNSIVSWCKGKQDNGETLHSLARPLSRGCPHITSATGGGGRGKPKYYNCWREGEGGSAKCWRLPTRGVKSENDSMK